MWDLMLPTACMEINLNSKWHVGHTGPRAVSLFKEHFTPVCVTPNTHRGVSYVWDEPHTGVVHHQLPRSPIGKQEMPELGSYCLKPSSQLCYTARFSKTGAIC